MLCLFVLPFSCESGTSCEVRWGVGKQINIRRTSCWRKKREKIWRRRRRDGEELMDEWVPQAVAGMTHMGRGTFHLNTHTHLSLSLLGPPSKPLATFTTPLVINFYLFSKIKISFVYDETHFYLLRNSFSSVGYSI